MKVKDCVVCTAYHQRRAHVLAPHIARRAFIRGVSPMVVTVEFMFGVHARHLGGGSLSTRTRTPGRKLPTGGTRFHMSRCCNGCGTDLGDVTRAEVNAAIAGQDLPDVRLECGCLPQNENGAAA